MPASVLPPSLDEGRGRSGPFEQVYRRSLDQPEQFWAQAAAEIDWVQIWERVLHDSRKGCVGGAIRSGAAHGARTGGSCR